MLKNTKLKLALAIISAAFLMGGTASTANAANFDFNGNIANHNDVVIASFTLANDATNVKMWTDSYLSGVNFDPIVALWNSVTGALIQQVDDNSSIAPGQTRFDSGLSFANLAAGTYNFTVATYNNWAVGTNLAQGFIFDNQAPIALAVWNQPASHLNMGSYWDLHLSGVDTASVIISQVPEPTSIALLGMGLLGFAASRRKKLV